MADWDNNYPFCHGLMIHCEEKRPRYLKGAVPWFFLDERFFKE